jgi:hypothetical protein
MATRAFSENGKDYYPITNLHSTGIQWGCRHEDGLETRLLIRQGATKAEIVEKIRIFDVNNRAKDFFSEADEGDDEEVFYGQ